MNTQKRRIGAEIYITDNKEVYEKFLEKKSEIETYIGMDLEWKTASKDCRIIAFQSGDIRKGVDAWQEYFEWYCEMAVKLRNVTQKFGI